MRITVRSATSVMAVVFVAAVAARSVGSSPSAPPVANPAVVVDDAAAAQADPVARGRFLITSHACGVCHGGMDDPSAKGWLQGASGPETEFKIGPPPCGVDPKATGCFTTRPRNLTPDELTGMGHFTERQLFNALRYGLRPEDTPDVTITSTTPGQGNFPMRPHFLAPPMPWSSWRHMSDTDLRAIAAYIKRGLKPVAHKVADSEGPPDFWASMMVPAMIGTYPAAPFPTAFEQEPPAKDRARVLKGRQSVLEHGCADCHESFAGPSVKGWLAGVTDPTHEFVIGPCWGDVKAPCFHGRAKNLTPDKETGIGRFTDRQLFNALRHGLRPEDTPDLEITSDTPGQGNFPKDPHYLGPFMPWYNWRHMSDDELNSIIAYLRLGLKPVNQKIKDSDDVPDHWASALKDFGKYPATAFPTANEIKK
jgi:mono/diheme cytochrome c family protein